MRINICESINENNILNYFPEDFISLEKISEKIILENKKRLADSNKSGDFLVEENNLKEHIQKILENLIVHKRVERKGNFYRQLTLEERIIRETIGKIKISDDKISNYIFEIIENDIAGKNRKLIKASGREVIISCCMNIKEVEQAINSNKDAINIVFLLDSNITESEIIDLKKITQGENAVIVLRENGYKTSVLKIIKIKEFIKMHKKEIEDKESKVFRKILDELVNREKLCHMEIEFSIKEGNFFVAGHNIKVPGSDIANKIKNIMELINNGKAWNKEYVGFYRNEDQQAKYKAKKFAEFSRCELIEKVSNKAKKLGIRSEICEHLLEEIAFTWFNRFLAIRYMDVNGYLKEKDIFLFTAEREEEFKKEILDICDEFCLIMPGIFGDSIPWIRELFPDDLASPDSIIRRMIRDISREQWLDSVELIGWLYQYYNDEKKKNIFKNIKSNKRIKKDDVPAATQLFTPDWLVRYMVENTLGRLWIENLTMECKREEVEYFKGKWKFYIDQDLELNREYVNLEEIKIIDPAVGSGNILSYAFDLLMEIYISRGYTKEDAASSIIGNNLYGLEIDKRAAQMAYFTLIVKGRKYDKDFFKKEIRPNIFEIETIDDCLKEEILEKIKGKKDIFNEVKNLFKVISDAKEYGSCIKISKIDFHLLKNIDEKLDRVLKWCKLLTDTYHVVVTNPPYMTMYNMSNKLLSYVKKNYPHGKHDMFSVFMEKCNELLREYGYRGMLTQHSWMFLSAYEELRKEMLEEKLVNLIHLGTRAFEDILGDIVQTVAFVTEKTPYKKGETSVFKRLINGQREEEKIEEFYNSQNDYIKDQGMFKNLPGNTIAYWQSENFLKSFSMPVLSDYYPTKKGMFTGNNEYFLKKWYEICEDKIGKDFLVYNKGGRYRKWYGCNETVVKWHKNGEEIKAYKGSGNINEDWFYDTCISWNLVSASPFCCRIVEKGAVMGDAGPICLVREEDPNYYYLIGYLNSIVARNFIDVLNPTMNYPSGVIGNIPVKFTESIKDRVLIEEKVKECIAISKEDWINYETHMGFKENPLMPYIRKNILKKSDAKEKHSILEMAYEEYKRAANEKFFKIKSNQEDINEKFIEIFQVEKDLDNIENPRDITLTYVCDFKENVPIKLKGCRYVKYMEDIVVDFIGYIVGCMFDRYKFFDNQIIAGTKDNILYINTDEDIRYDEIRRLDGCNNPLDLASRFMVVLEKLFGKKQLDMELEFIKKALGTGQNKEPEKVIRRYFANNFYKDHVKKYAHRPIYWEFSSGNRNGFKCLIYYHKYSKELLYNIRVGYLHKRQGEIHKQVLQRENMLAKSTVKKTIRNLLEKQLGKLREQEKELVFYEEKLRTLENENISMDFDNGVLENYKKLQNVLSKV